MESLVQGYLPIFGIKTTQVLYQCEVSLTQNKKILLSLYFGPCPFFNKVLIVIFTYFISVRFLKPKNTKNYKLIFQKRILFLIL